MSNTRVISPIDMQMVKEYLSANLRINIETTSEYNGGIDGSDRMYKDHHTIQLVLDGDVISEIDL